MCQGRTAQGPKPGTRTPERGSLWARVIQRAQKRGLPRALAPSTPSGGSGLAQGWERASSRGLEELGDTGSAGRPEAMITLPVEEGISRFADLSRETGFGAAMPRVD